MQDGFPLPMGHVQPNHNNPNRPYSHKKLLVSSLTLLPQLISAARASPGSVITLVLPPAPLSPPHTPPPHKNLMAV